MLRIESIELRDFGPYKGSQRIDFVDANGVTVIYGDNGRGKTLLLNAIRFAFYGHVLGRGAGEQDLRRLANAESVEERGTTELAVVIEFDSDGRNYRLTRRFGPGEGGRLHQELVLTRNGSGLTYEEAVSELERILPEQISRFFLFDAELLQQYEVLVGTDDQAGEELKRAIERILGIPILTNSRTDVRELAGRVTTDLARAAQRNAETQALGNALQAAQEALELYSRNVEALQGDVVRLEAERDELQAELSRTERASSLIRERDRLRGELAGIENRTRQLRQDLAMAVGGLWRELLVPPATDRLERSRADLVTLRDRQRQAYFEQARARLRAEAVEHGVCPTCGQQVGDSIAFLASPDDAEHIDSEIRSLERVSSALQRFLAVPSTSAVAIEERIEGLNVEASDLRSRIEELTTAIADAPEDELRALALRFANVELSLSNTRERFREQQDALRNQEGRVRELQEALQAQTGHDDAHLNRKVELLTELSELFLDSIDHYRDSLKQRVEAEATRLFRLMSREEDFARLAINDRYGLTILHRDGREVPVRSAGYEHLVALSLLGALQACAPVRGPVFVDSPFGRLDPHHKQSVVAALPGMADQVVLLVYEGELPREQVVAALGPTLLAERQLVRRSAWHTTIEARQ